MVNNKTKRRLFLKSFSAFIGEANVRVGTSYDNKTDQWLGASLAANDGNVIVRIDFILQPFIYQ